MPLTANAAASDPATASPEPVTLTVTFAGDCTLGTDINYENERSFNSRWQAEEGDATYFLRNVADLFGSDDLTVVNMEGALTEGGERADKKFAFRGKPEYAKILSSASVEAATLANNHSQDYGQTGYDDTIAALDAEGVQSFGYDRIAYLDVKGVKVALIGSYFPEDSAENTKEMTDNIAAARAEDAQLVIVYVHWGQEHEYDITEGQQTAGRAAIDAGADLVVGSHPACGAGLGGVSGPLHRLQPRQLLLRRQHQPRRQGLPHLPADLHRDRRYGGQERRCGLHRRLGFHGDRPQHLPADAGRRGTRRPASRRRCKRPPTASRLQPQIRITQEPAVRPPPKAVMQAMSPGCSLPSQSASFRAMRALAPLTLPTWSMITWKRSMGRPIFLAA